MNEIKEVTLKELQSIIADTVKEALPELKKDIATDLSVAIKGNQPETEDEKIEKGAKFIKDLVQGNLTEKAVDSSAGSFGYTVPTGLAAFILQKRDKIAKMRKYAFSFKMTGNFQLPTEGTGVTAYWVAENASITISSPTIAKKDLADYYLAARVLIPRNLIKTSAYNIVNFIGELAARAIRNTEETAFVAGDGAGKPTGLRSASLTSIAQAGATLAYSDIVSLFYSLAEQYRNNAVFITSASGVKALRNIVDTQGLPIFGVNDQKVFNKVVLESEDIPANLGTNTNATEIYFGDLWYYWIKDGETMFVDTDKILANLQIELVVAEAVDGVLTNTDAFRKLTAVV